MIDTLRLKLPLTPLILRQIHESSRRELTWAGMGQKFFAPLIISPHNRELMIIKEFDYPLIKRQSQNMSFFVEGSIPNLEYGENVNLFYPENLPNVFARIEKAINEQYGTVPSWNTWEVQRVDPVYAWKFPDKGDAAKVLGFFQALSYPQKDKRTYGDETIVFRGRSYSIQLYLKEFEYLKHGYKKLVQLGQREFADQTLKLSQEVLRFEIRIFKAKLQTIFKKKIITCNDLLDSSWYITILDECLTRLLKTPNRYSTSDLDSIVKLKQKYKDDIAIRKFFFWKYFYLDETNNKLIKENFDSTTISRNMKDIARAGIGLATPLDFPKLFDLSIPSKNVVNTTNNISIPVGMESEFII